MKKLIFSMIMGLVLTSSCVELIQEPQSFLTEEDYIQLPKNLDQVARGITGLYNDLWYNNYGMNCRIMRLNTGADDITTSPKPNNTLNYLIDLNPSLSGNDMDASELWANFWKSISSSNKIINGTPIPADVTEAAKYKAVIAEAYFVRALSYFYLVRIFGDIPLIKSSDEAILPQTRKSVAEIYDNVIVPDLEFAIANLPVKSRSGNSSTPSKWAAKICLADVYMNMAGWPLKKGTAYYAKAASETKDIIDNSGLSLTPAYKDLWMETTKTAANEHIFALHHSVAYKNPSQYGKSLYPRDYKLNAGWADYHGTPTFLANYPNDERKAHNYMLKWDTKTGVKTWEESQDKLPSISKYYNYDEGPAGKSAQSNGITPIYRYADALLMYAEASNLATSSVNDQAIQSLNLVQNRAKSPIITTTRNSEEFDTAVLNERGWEFFAEFHRWFDLVRKEKLSVVKPQQWQNSLFKKNNHYYMPVPIKQIQMTGWTNNLGY